jgi:hypothetical protein
MNAGLAIGWRFFYGLSRELRIDLLLSPIEGLGGVLDAYLNVRAWRHRKGLN